MRARIVLELGVGDIVGESGEVGTTKRGELREGSSHQKAGTRSEAVAGETGTGSLDVEPVIASAISI